MALNTFFTQKKAEWETISRNYHELYKQKHDVKIITDLIKKNSLAIKGKWVREELQKFFIMGLTVKTKEILLPKPGEKADRFQKKCLNWMLVDKVNDLVKAGISYSEAFKKISQDGLAGIHKTEESLKNAYYRHKNFSPDILIEEAGSGYIVTLAPGKLELGDNPKTRVYALYEIAIP